MSMIVADLIVELTRRGIKLEAKGEKLRFRPINAVSHSLVERMKTHKQELLALLASEPEPLSHAQCEALRFLNVCIPYPDGRGAYDPAYADTINALAYAPLPQFMNNSA